jgi:NADPH:quinone reductase-like Zn-dependent oxidoreductase
MKAIQITGYGDINGNTVLSEIDKPVIKNNQVLIEIYAAGVNPVDYKIIGGAFKQISPLSFPASIGFDLSGKIVEAGSEVKNLAVGDEVFSRVPSDSAGTFAEFIAVDSSVVVKKPENISFEEVAGIPLVGLTTVQAFQIARLKPGDKVLIHAGSGGIGSFAVQYAKAKGAYVYTTTSTANVSWVKELGADRVIDYRKENYLDIVKDADIVYDTLGQGYTLDAFKVIKNGGKVVSISGPLDSVTAQAFGLNPIIRFVLAVQRRKITKALKAKSALYRFLLMNPDGAQLRDLADMITSNTIRPVVDKVFRLDEGIEALNYQHSGRAKGKIIIKMK